VPDPASTPAPKYRLQACEFVFALVESSPIAGRCFLLDISCFALAVAVIRLRRWNLPNYPSSQSKSNATRSFSPFLFTALRATHHRTLTTHAYSLADSITTPVPVKKPFAFPPMLLVPSARRPFASFW
jgi:hypothetical protein